MKFDSRRLRNEVVVVVGLGTRELLLSFSGDHIPGCFILDVSACLSVCTECVSSSFGDQQVSLVRNE